MSAPLVSQRVGALACQMSSYLKELKTVVVSCCKNATDENAFDVVLQDSVFFPEGGGQPSDLGTINDAPIKGAVRVGDVCVIRTEHSLEVGAEVLARVDWARRLDHMQHHTAQHLLTAIVERELGLPTECWSLTHPSCYIQVPTDNIKDEDIRRIELICNTMIADGVEVQRRVFQSRADVPPSRSRGIPADVNGPIRIIDVEGVDSCTCCGTHVENLTALRMLKLLHQEPKGKTCKLHFVAGDRVSKIFTTMYQRERAFIKELGTHSENLLPTIVMRGTERNDATKANRKLLTELATVLAPNIAASVSQLTQLDEPFVYYREDVDMDFLAVVADAISKREPSRLAILGCGKGDQGQFLFIGPAPVVAIHAPNVASGLDGKGGLSKTGFRGKGNMKRWKAVVADLLKAVIAQRASA